MQPKRTTDTDIVKAPRLEDALDAHTIEARDREFVERVKNKPGFAEQVNKLNTLVEQGAAPALGPSKPVESQDLDGKPVRTTREADRGAAVGDIARPVMIEEPRSRWPLIALAALVVGGVGLALLFFLRGDDPTPATTTPVTATGVTSVLPTTTATATAVATTSSQPTASSGASVLTTSAEPTASETTSVRPTRSSAPSSAKSTSPRPTASSSGIFILEND